MIISFLASACTPEYTFLLQYNAQLPQARLAAQKLTERLEEAGLRLVSENATYEIHLITSDR